MHIHFQRMCCMDYRCSFSINLDLSLARDCMCASTGTTTQYFIIHALSNISVFKDCNIIHDIKYWLSPHFAVSYCTSTERKQHQDSCQNPTIRLLFCNGIIRLLIAYSVVIALVVLHVSHAFSAGLD